MDRVTATALQGKHDIILTDATLHIGFLLDGTRRPYSWHDVATPPDLYPGDASYQSHAYVFSLCWRSRPRWSPLFDTSSKQALLRTKLYPDCSQQTQEIILQDFDSIFQEHGSGIRPKQWAKADITEGTDRKSPRFRLSCINATRNEPCNFHLSLLWDTHLHA